MEKEYADIVRDLCGNYLESPVEVRRIPARGAFVWRALAGPSSWIVKLGPLRPYRLRREIRAYGRLHGSPLRTARVVASGESGDIPFVILEDCGAITVADVVAEPVSERALDLVGQTIAQLGLLASEDGSEFAVIRDGRTTRDRDRERLDATACSTRLQTGRFRPLFERLQGYIRDDYGDLSHRDCAPRQAVVREGRVTLVDFESMGPGQFERDVGDVLGGIAKFGVWSDRYARVGIQAAAQADMEADAGKILDYAAFSCLWSVGAKDEPGRVDRLQAAAACLLGLKS